MFTGRALDVAGLVRRARRAADLSQRDLAAALSLDQSTIARWETGRSCPSVEQFGRVLGLAALEVSVRDASGREVGPMTTLAPTDRQRRRFPAHLDLDEENDPMTGDPQYRVRERRARDERRARAGAVPVDHPTRAEFARRRRARVEERRSRLALWRAATAREPTEAAEPCACPPVCDEGRTCVPACGCRCEPAA